jgi:hypothetical protein
MLLRTATFVPHSPAIHGRSWLSWRQAGNGGKIAEKAAIDLRAVITKSISRIVGLDVPR